MASDPPLAQSLRRLPFESASLRLLPLLIRGERPLEVGERRGLWFAVAPLHGLPGVELPSSRIMIVANRHHGYCSRCP